MTSKWRNSTFAVGLLGLTISAPLAAQSKSYTVTDLGPAGNPFSVANFLNNHGVIAGSDTVVAGSASPSHAVLWYKDVLVDIKAIVDLQQPGLLGPNSAAGFVNDSGLVVVGGETPNPDPNNENFCGTGTGLQCVVFLLRNGVLSQLPNPLGGTNSFPGAFNNRGEVAGFAENAVHRHECLATAPNGTGPQVLDYEAVIWGPGPGQFRQLPPLTGDSVGIALGMNDQGQVVGVSGRCGNTVIPGFVAGPHSVLWEADSSVHEIPNFGGTSNPAVLAVGNAALAINNKGQVAGTSALPGSMVNQPFIWSKEKGLQHLQLIPGDVVGAGLGINSGGEVVGASISPGGPATGNPSAVVWQNGAEGGVTDLNRFLAANSPFTALLTAFGINDAGDIVGFGVTNTGDVHAFLAMPARGASAGSVETAAPAASHAIALSEKVRALVFGRFAIGR